MSGITIERTTTGKPAFIKFRYDKYAGLLQSFFIEHNIEIPMLPNEDTKTAIKEAKQNKLQKFENADALFADLYK
jgi:hypothetical protein